MKLALWIASLGAVAGAPAQAITLDFGNGPSAPVICSANADGSGAPVACGNGSFINQSYGDIASALDVSYAAPRATGAESLRWWANSYNTLYGVLWAGGSDSNSQARVELRPLDGNAVTLTSFQLGAYPSSVLGTALTVTAIGSSTPALTFNGNVGVGNLPTTFTVGLSSATGWRIEWADSAYNVGIDNLEFTLAPVPEASSFGMLAGGLALLAAAARRRAGNPRQRTQSTQ